MPTSPSQGYLVSDVLAGLAVVAVDRPITGADVDTVVVDNVGGAATATGHLASHGHERIALLTDLTSIWTASQRHEGYLRGLAASRVSFDAELVVTDVRTSEGATAEVHRLLALADPPTAIFAARNNLAIGTVRALRQLDLADTIALVGFDDFPMADLVTPAITVIQQDITEVGRAAADLLFAQLDGAGGPPQKVVLPTTLVPRGSGELPPQSLADAG
jgi:LacI family transcriptional regulator